MVKDIIERLNELAPLGDQLEQFETILELPDDRFASVYEELKPKLKEIFSSKAFYEEMISNIKTIPMGNIEEEKKVVEEFVEEIKTDDSLSNEKKDFLVTLIEEAVLVTFELYEVPRERVTVKIERINDNAIIPTYAHKTDAGADVYAAEDVTILAGETKIVKTGLKVAIPVGYEIQVRPRSGLSAKSGLRIANSPGTVDAGYRGELGVIMTNIGTNAVETISVGDKIAQLVISEVPMIKWEEGTIEDNTERGEGGFGSTDNKDN